MTRFFKPWWICLYILCSCTSNSSPSADGTSYTVASAAGASLATFSFSDQDVLYNDNTGALRGVTKRSDKRKYYDNNNAMQYAVKLDDDGFKLRDSQEQLLWKVKLYPDKLKISNNEEMSGAYEVKLYEDGKLKLKKDESEIKSIRLSGAGEDAVDQQYIIKGFGTSLAAGILLVPGPTDREKFLIMAELALRKR